MIEKQDQPVVVAPSLETDEQVKSQDELRELFWRAAVRIGERNRDKDPDEILAVVTEVVEEVRRERHEREQREAANRR